MMEGKSMKARIVYPKGLEAREHERLQEALQALEKAPRVERKETLKIALPSSLSKEEMKKAKEAIMSPIKRVRESLVYDTVVEETSVEEVEETTVEVSSRLGR
ncbi:hypothetical protein CHL67_07790 [Prosthecochloris sp. GSB1]|uniref:hypothetical protein n=1 Tax=Prosthecochloris sp. GSB1 TaxID=281093 RepID=UPI000B8C9912|nr:hypothetical protein [Prosthecochloris sp. GSB1]ASQ90833.1 hypothetical protein CHL67_07790 [Prosthecochloris sp. GSB1]